MDPNDKVVLCWAALIAAVIITLIVCDTIETIHKAPGTATVVPVK